MSDYLDIATSLHTNSLTLFIGTGFSKYMTNDQAPNWLELIVECTKAIDSNEKILNQLFNTDSFGNVKEARYDLTICAQILEGEFIKKRKNIRDQIAEIIKIRINENTIDAGKLTHLQSFFNAHPNINVITTNYDTIFSDFVIPITSRVVIEGSAIPRVNSGQNIYHIHGCITRPESIILTINDYYNFQNSNNYFSRKFFTLLQESTVAILGYSLADFNLNTILNEVKNSKKQSFRKTDIYYVTRDNVPNVMERFYSMTYGIKVIPQTQPLVFFDNINAEYPKAKALIESVKNLRDVMAGTHTYVDDFLKLRVSLTTVLLQAASIGIESKDNTFIKTLLVLLKKKKAFTSDFNAWSQYEHLAEWLIEIASIVPIKNTEFEEEFCEIAKYSFSKCSKRLYKGYSWHAWSSWHNRWHEMKIENQLMLEDLINNNLWDNDLQIREIIQ